MQRSTQFRAGALRHRVTFESRQPGSDINGGPQTTWLPTNSMWSSIESLSGRELIAAQALNAEVSHRITVRYRSALSNPTEVVAMRLRFKDRIFNILQATNTNEQNFEIAILASEGLNLG